MQVELLLLDNNTGSYLTVWKQWIRIVENI